MKTLHRELCWWYTYVTLTFWHKRNVPHNFLNKGTNHVMKNDHIWNIIEFHTGNLTVPYLLRKMTIFGTKMYSIQVISHSAIFVKKNDHIWNINVFHTGNILQCHICNTKWPYLEHKMYFKLIKNVVNFPNTLYFLWKIYLYYGIEE